jgi:GrpB-like predicted nucleotidyltransferase (UPF0157 family)
VEIEPEPALRPKVAAAWSRLTAQLQQTLPDADIEHIGATAVPGALTKGDLDVLVSVAEDQFEEAIDRLSSRYTRHHPEEWTTDLASFREEPASELPVGIQLVIAGGRSERVFLRWRDLLRQDRQLLDRYDDFKVAHAGDGYAEYTEAKAGFIERELGESLDRSE